MLLCTPKENITSPRHENGNRPAEQLKRKRTSGCSWNWQGSPSEHQRRRELWATKNEWNSIPIPQGYASYTSCSPPIFSPEIGSSWNSLYYAWCSSLLTYMVHHENDKCDKNCKNLNKFCRGTPPMHQQLFDSNPLWAPLTQNLKPALLVACQESWTQLTSPDEPGKLSRVQWQSSQRAAAVRAATLCICSYTVHKWEGIGAGVTVARLPLGQHSAFPVDCELTTMRQFYNNFNVILSSLSTSHQPHRYQAPCWDRTRDVSPNCAWLYLESERENSNLEECNSCNIFHHAIHEPRNNEATRLSKKLLPTMSFPGAAPCTLSRFLQISKDSLIAVYWCCHTFDFLQNESSWTIW